MVCKQSCLFDQKQKYVPKVGRPRTGSAVCSTVWLKCGSLVCLLHVVSSSPSIRHTLKQEMAWAQLDAAVPPHAQPTEKTVR